MITFFGTLWIKKVTIIFCWIDTLHMWKSIAALAEYMFNFWGSYKAYCEITFINYIKLYIHTYIYNVAYCLRLPCYILLVYFLMIQINNTHNIFNNGLTSWSFNQSITKNVLILYMIIRWIVIKIFRNKLYQWYNHMRSVSDD